jgi:cytochrome c oxidase subunit 2
MRQGGRFGRRRFAIGAASVAASALSVAAAWGQEPYGHAEAGQIGFQAPVTDLARYLQWFHNDILVPVIVAISLFVLGLLIYVVWRFRETVNPTPSRTTHNAALEVAWTIAPVIILLFIAVPSFRLLTMQLTLPPPEVTVKVTASQWHWNYAYPKDEGDFSFDSFMKDQADLKPENGDIRLLTVDNEAVVPINKVVRLQITATDVIHSFVVQSFGVRVDAVPGRSRGRLLRAVLQNLRQGSRLHADRLPGGQPGQIRRLARRREEEVRRRSERDPRYGLRRRDDSPITRAG